MNRLRNLHIPALVYVLLGALLLHNAWLLFRWGGPARAEWFSDLHYLAVVYAVTLVVWHAGRRCAPEQRVAFGFLLAASVTRVVAESLWAYLELIVDSPPFPSVADVFYLATYPLLGLAFLSFARANLNIRGLQATRLLLDSGIAVSAVGVVAWQAFLAGIALNETESLTARLVSLVYPALDLGLLALLLLVVFRAHALRPFEMLFALGLACDIVADLWFAALNARDAYVNGHVVDAIWTWGFTLIGLGAWAALGTRGASPEGTWRESRSAFRSGLTAVVPYVATATAFVLLARAYREVTLTTAGVLAGTAVVTLLVMLRQTVAFAENVRLNRDLRASQQRLAELAHHDALTQLPNRLLFEERLRDALDAARSRGGLVSVLFVDLDGFKRVNDTLGHAAGDRLLQAVAGRLRAHARDGDVIARLGGDEFTVMLVNLAAPEEAGRIAQRMLDALQGEFELNGHAASVTASIGVSLYPTNGADAGALLRAADVAMYHAKASGKNQLAYFTLSMREAASTRAEVEEQLWGALDRGEFTLHYQPRLATNGVDVVGAEALLRWMNPKLGIVPPGVFVPIAERAGLMIGIGGWVLGEACQQAAGWFTAGHEVPVSVNVSATQFTRPDFTAVVQSTLRAYGLPGHALELEITEGQVTRELDEAARAFGELRDIGVRVSVDDVGAGSSVLASLMTLPVSTLKVDRRFVLNLESTASARRVVRAVQALGEALDLTVVAEGVETDAQLNAIRQLGYQSAQGYLLGHPMPAEQFRVWLAQRGD